MRSFLRIWFLFDQQKIFILGKGEERIKNMNLLQRVVDSFNDSIETKRLALHLLPEKIVQAAALMVDCVQCGNKILVCGNGGSASDAQHFVAELVNRFAIEREPIAAIALNTDVATITAIANDYDYAQIFSKQVQAIGNEGDVLLAISTSGNSANVVEAIHMAKANGMNVVALTGKDGGLISNVLNEYGEDIELRVIEDSTPRIQEVHILIIHCLCDLIEQQLSYS